MKNLHRITLALLALALPSLALAATPVKEACCALCAACGMGYC